MKKNNVKQLWTRVLALLLTMVFTLSEVSVTSYATEMQPVEKEVTYETEFETPYVDVTDGGISNNSMELEDLVVAEAPQQEDSIKTDSVQDDPTEDDDISMDMDASIEEGIAEEMSLESIEVKEEKMLLSNALERGSDITPVSRGAWLDALLKSFNYKVDSSAYEDEYFPDITSDSPYYDVVMNALAWGLVDIEAGDNFNAEEYCTREYAVFTLNKFLGFVNDSVEYSFAEASDVTYANDIQVAVEKEWFALDGNKFCPEMSITEADKDALLTYAYEVCNQFDDDGENSYEFAENVINLDAYGIKREILSVDEDGNYSYELTEVPADISLQVGDIFGFVDSGVPFAKEIIEVTRNSSTYTVKTESATDEQAFKVLEVAGVNEIALSSIESLTDGLDFEYIVGGTEEKQYEDGKAYDSAAALQGRAVSAIRANVLYSLEKYKPIKDKEFSSSLGKYLKLKVTFTDMKVGYQYSLGEIIQVALYGKMTVKYTITMDVLEELGQAPTITLGEIILGEYGIVTLEFEMSMQASLEVTEVKEFGLGVEVSKATGSRMIRYFNCVTPPIVKSTLRMTAGLKLSYKVNWFVLSAQLYAKTGVGGSYESCRYQDDRYPNLCENLKVWTYYQTGWKVNCELDKANIINKSGNFTDVNEFNSPMRVNYHWEDEVQVETCTRQEDWNAQKKPIKYYTGRMSKHGWYGKSADGESNYNPFTYTIGTDGTATITQYNGYATTLVIPDTITDENNITYTVTGVGNGKCIIPEDNQKKIRTVFFPDTVTKIGVRAFQKCTSLVSMQLPKSLKHIDYYAFQDCSSLTQVDLPEGLTKLGSGSFGSVFNGCTSLRKLYIPASLTEVNGRGNSGNFAGCLNLDGDGITFGDNITKINMILSGSNITHITLPDTIIEIGTNAFFGCQNLKTISVPDCVTTIDIESFRNCVNLESFEFPQNLIMIDNHAFDGCTSLEEAILPKGLQTMGSNSFGMVFENCSSLKKVFIPKSLTTISNIGNQDNGIFANTPLQAEGVIFEEGIEAIPNYLFQNTAITSITLPDTIKTIGKNAFYSCDNLTKIVLPEGLETIGEAAFKYCTKLKEIQVPNGVTSLGKGAFENCTDLDHFPLSESSLITDIQPNTFKNTKSIKDVVIPTNVRKVEEWAFQSAAIESVVLSENLESIGQKAFLDCEKLHTIDFSKATKLKSFSGAEVFSGCVKLTNVELPDSITNASTGVFKGCVSLKTVKLSSGMTTIGTNFFNGCSALENVIVPFRVTSIGSTAFANCASLISITIPKSVTSINTNAFSYKKVVIKGVAGSYANTFAASNGYTFEPIEKAVTEIRVPSQELTMKLNEELTLQASILPEDFTDAILFYLEDESSGVINIKDASKGVIRALKTGDVTVIIESDSGAKTEVLIHVYQPVAGVSIRPSSVTLEGGKTSQLTASISPTTALNKEVRWEIEDETIATVTQDGAVLGKKKGQTTVKAISLENESLFGTATVNVTSTVNRVTRIEDLQSKHKYENGTNETWIYRIEGASGLEVTFDSQTNIHKTDKLYVLDVADKEIGAYSETSLQGKSIVVPGDTVKIKLVAGDALNAWGFAVTSVEPYITKYNITYNLNGGINSANNPEKAVAGTDLNLENPTKEGYIFEDWYENATFTKKWENGSTISGNISLFAKFSPRKYSITYVLNDTELEPAFNAPDNREKYTIEDENFLLLDANRPGYRFAGWYKESETQTQITTIDSSAMQDIVVYAKWDVIPKVKSVEAKIVSDEEETIIVKDNEHEIRTNNSVSVTLSSETENASIYYTLDGTTPSLSSSVYNGTFDISYDTELKAIAFADGYLESDISSWTISIKEPEGYLGDVEPEDIQGQDIPTGIWIANTSQTFTYTGKAQKFDNLKVYYYKTLLESGTDYTISYKNNTKAYTLRESDTNFVAKNAPQIIIKGKGKYKDQKTVYFTIAPIDIGEMDEEEEMSIPDLYAIFSPSKGQKPVPSLKYKTTQLKNKTDYTYTYRDGNTVVDSLTQEKEYTLQIVGQGNYCGTITREIKVYPAETKVPTINSLKFSSIPAQPYIQGGYTEAIVEELLQNLDDKFTVLAPNGEKLSLGTDYDVSKVWNTVDSNNNAIPGTVTVKINSEDYKGDKFITFKVNGIPVTKAKLLLDFDKDVYSGKAIEPTLVNPTYVVGTDTFELTEETDYELSYINNVKAGTATVVITGKGGYTGSKKLTFKILPKEIKQNTSLDGLVVEGLKDDYYYEKGGVKPNPVIKFQYSDNEDNDKTRILVSGKDYTIKYNNFTKVASKNEENAPQILITLKGDFNGQLSYKYSILQQNIAKTKVTLSDKVYTGKANAWLPKIIITDVNGKNLTASDYDSKKIKYTYARNTIGIGRANGAFINVTAGTEINKDDIPPVGCYITASIQGIGTYTGKVLGTYKIIAKEKDISKAKVKFVNDTNGVYSYTGKEIRPGKKDMLIEVKDNGQTIQLQSTDYTILSYSNNLQKGKATLIIKGNGAYGGTKSINFTIAPQSLSYASVF